MIELNDIQREIIGSLTFVEPFETLVEEVDATEPVIISELRDLIDKRFVQVMTRSVDSGEFEKSFYYDADNMRDFSYVATSTGMQSYSGG